MDISQRESLAKKKKKKEWACWSYEFLEVLKVGDKDPRSEEIESLSKIATTYFFLHNMPFELKQSWEKCLAAFFLSFFFFIQTRHNCGHANGEKSEASLFSKHFGVLCFNLVEIKGD